MTKLEFAANDSPTIGVELELGIVDCETMSLSSSVGQLIPQLPQELTPFVKPELMQSCIEVITGVCTSVDEAGEELCTKLSSVEKICDQNGVALWWGATHPFSLWRDQQVTPNDRYHDLVNSLQEMARRLVTFGLHIHVGVDSGDKAVMICDRILQHLPTLLALTASSPFWENRNTGLHSQRSKIMEGLPTAGLPPLMRNWSEYVWLVNQMVDSGFINTIREIWWDVRPHHNFGTVEVRVCDMPGNLEDVLAITALVQSLVKTLSDMIDNGAYQHDCHPMMVRQNKWRAARFGTRAKLVNSFTYEVQSLGLVVNSLVEKLTPVAEQLGCLQHLEHTRAMAAAPSWAEKQTSILDKTGNPHEVVRQLIQQSRISET
jgi:carboxylate-amine ligase